MMEATRTSEAVVNIHQTTQCYNPDNSLLHTQCYQNLKSYSVPIAATMYSKYDSRSCRLPSSRKSMTGRHGLAHKMFFAHARMYRYKVSQKAAYFWKIYYHISLLEPHTFVFHHLINSYKKLQSMRLEWPPVKLCFTNFIKTGKMTHKLKCGEASQAKFFPQRKGVG
jgi:hypothetical protein